MNVDVLGCRGSTPADGSDFARYGGATSSFALSQPGFEADLILDAGTGIRHLSKRTDQPFRGTVLLSHLHWDHIQGLPFSPLLDHPEAEVQVVVPAGEQQAAAAIARFMSPPTFPIGPEGLLGRWTFVDLEPGNIEIDGWHISSFEVRHKGGRTFGYRISYASTSLAYIPDHAPGAPGSGPDGLGTCERGLLAQIEGVDVLLHDGQLLDAEFAERAHFGHAALGYARALARAADVGMLAVIHHDPARSDAELDYIATELDDADCLAYQGMRIELT